MTPAACVGRKLRELMPITYMTANLDQTDVKDRGFRSLRDLDLDPRHDQPRSIPGASSPYLRSSSNEPPGAKCSAASSATVVAARTNWYHVSPYATAWKGALPFSSRSAGASRPRLGEVAGPASVAPVAEALKVTQCIEGYLNRLHVQKLDAGPNPS